MDETGDLRCLYGESRGGFLKGEGTEFKAVAVSADENEGGEEAGDGFVWRAMRVATGQYTHRAPEEVNGKRKDYDIAEGETKKLRNDFLEIQFVNKEDVPSEQDEVVKAE